MARDDPPASSTAAAMRGKVGSEFETSIMRQCRQTDTDIVAKARDVYITSRAKTRSYIGQCSAVDAWCMAEKASGYSV